MAPLVHSPGPLFWSFGLEDITREWLGAEGHSLEAFSRRHHQNAHPQLISKSAATIGRSLDPVGTHPSHQGTHYRRCNGFHASHSARKKAKKVGTDGGAPRVQSVLLNEAPQMKLGSETCRLLGKTQSVTARGVHAPLPVAVGDVMLDCERGRFWAIGTCSPSSQSLLPPT